MRWMLLVSLGVAGYYTYAITEKKAPFNPSAKKVIPTKKIDPRLKNAEWTAELKRLRGLGERMETYAKQQGLNTRFGFLADMKLPSGRKRFFIYDMQYDSVLFSGLVAHGSGNTYSENIQFSNEPGSYCTSPGRYKIGSAYYGKFGLAYKLHGMDASNSNAYARAVVLHSYSCVPDNEIPGEICESLGCPMVSPAFLAKLQTYLENSQKPMMLWIVN